MLTVSLFVCHHLSCISNYSNA